MFHRRLLLLLAVISCATVALGAQLFRLTVIHGPAHREEAEQVLSTRTLLPTVRGTIHDCKGRVLAEDRPCYDVSVDYDVITGQWAYDQARHLAYRDYKKSWAKLSFDQREALVAQYRGPFDQQLDRLWSTLCEYGGIDRAELDRRKRTIIERVQTIRADVWDRQSQRRAQEADGPIELGEPAPIRIAEEYEPHTLLPAVADTVAYRFNKLKDELPGLHVVRAKTRVYPYRTVGVTLDRSTLPTPLRSDKPMHIEVQNVGAHIIGAMRDSWAEDEARRPFYRKGDSPDLGGYLPGDRVGLGGVEQSQEDRLRGDRGELLHRKDNDSEIRTDPLPGKDVDLTIDLALQARIRAIMDPSFGLMRVQAWQGNDDMPTGAPLFGSAVVMDVDSGHILALVSTPAPPARVEGQPYPDLTHDPERPLINKPIAAVYPPGSTVKPLVYCMAAVTKNIGWDQKINCRGYLLDGKPNIYRCWGWRPSKGEYYHHGLIGPDSAIAQSCNIYFYTCGMNMGAKTIVEQFGKWGFGKLTHIGLPEEVDGMLPNLTGPNPPGRELNLPNAIMMGIGQGPIAVPPLQIAAAHCALARGGYYLSPLLIHHLAPKQDGHDLHIPPPVVDMALKGMWESANEFMGTGNHLRIGDHREPILTLPDVTVRTKTGTAQAPVRFNDLNNNGKLDPGEPITAKGSHSWFVCHVQRKGDQRSKYVIVVNVEYGGHGGVVSGPVVNQILYALKAEGYL